MKTTIKGLVKLLKIAVEIIENEYPAAQHTDYKIPEMRRAILNAEKKIKEKSLTPYKKDV